MSEKPIRVLCYDPSFSNTGWAILDIKPSTGKVVVHRFGVLKPGQQADRVAHRDDVTTYGKRAISMKLLKECVHKLQEEFKPDYVSVEDAFFNPKRPNAYASLLFWICSVTIIYHENYQKPIYRIPTRTIKQRLTGSGGKGKGSVKDAIIKSEEIVFKQKKQAEIATDHEFDAIAVGYYFIKEILPSILSAKKLAA